MDSIKGRDLGRGASSFLREPTFHREDPRMGRSSPIDSIVCRITLTAVLLAGAAACGATSAPDDDDDGDGDGNRPVLLEASRSSTIALSGDRATVAMVNPDDDSLSIFQTSDDERVARVATGD